jgi:drug/metabolite transporter (DMT)-like permease
VSTTSPSATSSTLPARSKPGRAAVAGLLVAGIAVASVANALIAVIARAAGASADFQPLQPGAYVTFTVLGTLVGAVGWAVVRRRSANPRALLSWLVPAVLVVSFVPDLLMFVSDYTPHANAAGIIGLLVMHVVVAAVAVATYLRALPLHDGPRS